MVESIALQEIAKKNSDKEKIAGKIINKPDLLPMIFEGLKSDKASIRYGCEKILRIISQEKPEILYPQFSFFVKLLDTDKSFLKWGAIIILANLTRVDKKSKFSRIFDKYFSPIPGPDLIPAGNVIRSAATIAHAKPRLTEKIAREVLKVERAKYKTTECRNIALGHAIASLDRFYHQIKDKKSVVKLIKEQRKNSRNATRKKAEKFIKKHKIQLP